MSVEKPWGVGRPYIHFREAYELLWSLYVKALYMESLFSYVSANFHELGDDQLTTDDCGCRPQKHFYCRVKLMLLGLVCQSGSRELKR